MSILAVLLALVIWGLIFYVLWWGLGQMALPEPFGKVVTVLLIIGAVIVVIGILTGKIQPFPFLKF